jgi:hypothetical protein
MNRTFQRLVFVAVSAATLFTFSSCEKEPIDPCATVTCVNGDCINGACDCYPGYSGPSCANEDRPVKITLDRVELTSFPQTNPQGGGWDSDGTGPDVYVSVYSASNLIWEAPSYYGDAINSNSYSFIPSSPITLSSTEVFTIRVFDYETFAADTEMGGVSTTGELWSSYLKGKGFPSSTTFSAGGYGFTLYWTFTH